VWDYVLVCGMATKTKKKPLPASQWENVKLPKSLVNDLRVHSRETFIPMGKIATIAIKHYLETYQK